MEEEDYKPNTLASLGLEFPEGEHTPIDIIEEAILNGVNYLQSFTLQERVRMYLSLDLSDPVTGADDLGKLIITDQFFSKYFHTLIPPLTEGSVKKLAREVLLLDKDMIEEIVVVGENVVDVLGVDAFGTYINMIMYPDIDVTADPHYNVLTWILPWIQPVLIKEENEINKIAKLKAP